MRTIAERIEAAQCRYSRPTIVDFPGRIAIAASQTDRNPTDAQRKAGNYRTGKFWMWGHEISIENPKGSVRSGVSKSGKAWSVRMGAHYGFIRRTTGADGEQMDIFIGPHPESDLVCVVDQRNPEGKFDEHKIVVGARSVAEAKQLYFDCYSPCWQGFKSITPMTRSQFCAWLESGDHETPIAGQVSKYGKVDQPRDESGKWTKRYVGTKGDFERRPTFMSPSLDYARNYGGLSNRLHELEIDLGNSIDLTEWKHDDEPSREEVADVLKSYGIHIDPKKMGRGELHQILEPVRDEIAEQGSNLGFTHWVQNEHFDGMPQKTEYLLDPSRIQSAREITTDDAEDYSKDRANLRGRLAKYAKHDVSGEPRDEQGRWTAEYGKAFGRWRNAHLKSDLTKAIKWDAAADGEDDNGDPLDTTDEPAKDTVTRWVSSASDSDLADWSENLGIKDTAMVKSAILSSVENDSQEEWEMLRNEMDLKPEQRRLDKFYHVSPELAKSLREAGEAVKKWHGLDIWGRTSGDSSVDEALRKFARLHEAMPSQKNADRYARDVSDAVDKYSRLANVFLRFGHLPEQYKKVWTPEDDLKHPRGSNPDNPGQFSKVKVSVQKFGNRHYASADLPGGQKIDRSHEDADEAKRLAMQDIRDAGHDFEDEGDGEPTGRFRVKGNEIFDEHGVRHGAFRNEERAKQAATEWNERGKPGEKPVELPPEIKPVKAEELAPPKRAPKPPQDITQAANELQNIRNELASGSHDPEELQKRVDVVGEWVATQKYSPKVAKVLQESHQLSDKLQGGSGKGGVKIETVPDRANLRDDEFEAFKAEQAPKSERSADRPVALAEQGPKEGDRDDKGLIFRDGRWHREDADQNRANLRDRIEAAENFVESGKADIPRLRPEPEVTFEPWQETETDHELLDGHGEENQRPAEPAMVEPARKQSARVKAGVSGGTASGGGLGSVPESASGLGRDGLSEHAEVRDDGGVSGGNGAGGPAADESRGPRADDGLGSGGSGSGHGSDGVSGVAVQEVLTAPASPENPTDASAGNWRYHSRDFFQGGLKAKFQANLAALQTMRLIQDEGRTSATPAEQETMSKFVGWGQFPALFNENWQEARDSGMDLEEWYRDKDKWKEERSQLKPLMNDEEWAAAKRATLNSHFTHPSIVDAHWKMAQKLGFRGGRFLEPSAGIGYYLGMMPPELAGKTRTSAVELDQTTGDMLKLCYPSANVQVKGFQDHQAPPAFYDLVASNVPFGDYTVNDKAYNKHNAQIHDYFFLKSADMTKPGGLVMHVTSAGTMDKTDDSIRRELEKTCDFVAAIRFPGGAHQENAGTEVVTDMIILRKRHPGEEPVSMDSTPKEAEPKEPGFTGTTTDSLGRVYHWVDGKRVPSPDWLETTEVPDPDGGDPIRVNKYFADYPEQILGTLDRSGTMYRGDSKNVTRTDDYEERLQAAIDRLPEGVVTTGIGPVKETEEKREAGEDVKDGGFVLRDGKLFKREGGAEVPQDVTGPNLARIRGQLAIRDAWKKVVDAESNGQPADEARAELNQAYDAYVKKYGFLSERANKNPMKSDPDAPNLLAIEKWNEEKKTATKADMFSKETIRAHQRAEKADNVSEGTGISLNETGGVDIKRIAELTGKSEADVAAELVSSGLAFNDPSIGWQPADLYLSGNVRQKLTAARAAAAVDPVFDANVAALEKVQPEDIDFHEIDVKLGAPWVPPKDIERFCREVAGMGSGWRSELQINYVPELGQWQVHYSGRVTEEMKQLGTERRVFDELLESILNSKSLAIYDTDSEGGRHFNEIETRALQAKANEVKELFGEWIWKDEERQKRLHRYYNDNFNNVRDLSYDGGHLTFPGMNPEAFKKLRGIQKNFVWQTICTGKGLAAHEVGLGKTQELIASAMELRRLGLAKKPCIVALKANIGQITKKALQLYPGAKILSTADNFDAKNRKQTIARMATGDYDMVIMTHDQMDLLKMRPETEAAFVREQLDELEAAKVAAWHEDQSKNNRIVKALEKAKEKLETKLEKLIDSTEKDDAVHFEETGIDTLIVDEFHRYKSLPIITKGERIKGVPQSTSQRATNMLMRSQWLQEKNGGRGLIVATGTPVANTMAELFNLQRYLQPKELEARGIKTFDAWASAFGDRQTEMEPTVTGKFEPVSRFSKFVNVPELMSIVGQVMDVKRADDLKNPDGSPVVVRPKRKDSVVMTPKNEMTERMMAELAQRAAEIKERGKPEKGMDNMAVVCSDGRKGSLDPRMLYEDAEDHPDSKINQCVRNVLKISKDRPGVTQLIFSNVGVNPSPHTGFHAYGDIINKLVAGGIPRDKIADFSKLEGAAKDAAQEAMRRGDMLIALGSTEKLGTGVNVQNRIAALHHIDVPWQPADIEQRDGRGYRCGNVNDPTKPAKDQKVDIYKYVSEGSLDTFMWNLVAKKAHFINQVVNRKGSARSIRDEDTATLTPEQLMAVASGDPRILRKVQLDADVRELKMGKERHHRDQEKLKSRLKATEAEIAKHQEREARHAQDVEHLAKHAEAKPDFEMTVGGRPFVERKEADEALASHIAKLLDESYYDRTDAPIAEYRGFKIQPAKQMLEYGDVIPKLEIVGPSGERYQANTSLASIEANMRGIAGQHRRLIGEREAMQKDLATLKANADKGYKRAQDYEDKRKELAELDAELSAKHEEPVKPAETSRPTQARKVVFDEEEPAESENYAKSYESMLAEEFRKMKSRPVSERIEVAIARYVMGY